MRDLPVTVALSLLIHVAAATWFVARENTEAEHSVGRQTARVEIVAPIEEVPVEVVLFDDDTVNLFPDDPEPAAMPAVARVAAVDPRKRPMPAPAIVVTTTTTTELPPPIEPPPVTPPKKSKLSMRDGRPEPTIHRPGSDGISDEALKSMVEGTTPPVKISNLPGAQADADFDRAQARLSNSKFVEGATPDQLTAARFDRAAARQAQKEVELVAQNDGSYKTEKTTFKAKVNPDGTVDFKDKPNWDQKSLFSATFDATDAFMRKYGQDPYASEKLKYLDRTRDQRVEIGKRYRTTQLGQSAKLMMANLKRLWATIADPAERKRILFALWDECAESGDAELVEGGAAARRLLVNWIAAKHVAFTPAELTAFNAKKQSKATFAP